MMNPNDIEIARAAQPFRPFTIYVSDSRSFLIPQPNYVSISPDGHTIVVYDDQGTNILDIMLITGLGFMTPSRNGGE